MLCDGTLFPTRRFVATHRNIVLLKVHEHYTNTAYAVTACSVPPQASTHICQWYAFRVFYHWQTSHTAGR